jgi:hypothetical protein
MAWKDAIAEYDLTDLENMAAPKFAALARKGLWGGLLVAINAERSRVGLPSIRRPLNHQESNWEREINSKIDSVVMQLDASTGSYGSQGVLWIDKQFLILKQQLSSRFLEHHHD